MLTIRRQQIRALQESARSRFEDEMAAHLTRCFPGAPEVADRDRLRNSIREGLEAAKGYGIQSGQDVRQFLELATEYGPDFHQLPWAAQILNDRILSGTGKMEQIADQALFALSQVPTKDAAIQSLKQKAVAAAYDKLYSKYANDLRPNALFDASGIRKPLDPNNPALAGLRKEWMDSYKANGGQIAQNAASSITPEDAILPCDRRPVVNPVIGGEPVTLDDSADNIEELTKMQPEEEAAQEQDEGLAEA
jgi:hypothetical protein